MSDEKCGSCSGGSCPSEGQGGAPGGESMEQVYEQIAIEKQLSRIKNKIIVFSGKGGVGKSTVSVNLAMALSLMGKKVGLLDVDFHGPSIPKMLNLEGERLKNDDHAIYPAEISELFKVMSIGFLLKDESDAVIWRGPLKMGAIRQFIRDVAWGDLDYLIIDSPPGTGDEPLSVAQVINKMTGAVIVTTPQEVSLSDVRKSISFCRKLNMPVIGVVENMSGLVCPHCGDTIDLFKTGGGEKMSDEMGVPFLGAIPLDPKMVEAGDDGKPFVYHFSKTATAQAIEKIVEPIVDFCEKESASEPVEDSKQEPARKDDGSMKFAVPVAQGKLCMHFGHAEKFAIIDVENNEIKGMEYMTPPAHEPGVLPKWLGEMGVDAIIAGGMGSRAQEFFAEYNVKVVTGAQGVEPDEAVRQYLAGTLQRGDNICDH
ncbi:MAG TPA: iron-sulfur cluster carrier protein MrpORP [bacterium]|nr:iron-sulfur cluster carrier protein MrpORP [bacterium]